MFRGWEERAQLTKYSWWPTAIEENGCETFTVSRMQPCRDVSLTVLLVAHAYRCATSSMASNTSPGKHTLASTSGASATRKRISSKGFSMRSKRLQES